MRPSPPQPETDKIIALEAQIAKLEAERKELEREVQEKEILEKVIAGEIDLSPEQEQEIHKDCHSEASFAVLETELECAREERQGELDEVWDYLREFASHAAACCHGALVGLRRPHFLCTCGFNEVATELERQ